MSFCIRCGAALGPGARFCTSCGAQVAAAPAQQATAAGQVYVPEQAAIGQPAQPFVPAAIPYDFSAIPLRHKCVCGYIDDGGDSSVSCPKCGRPYQPGGIIHIYRMGNFAGMAVGMGIYINGEPFGHIGNKKSVRLALPYGQYVLHMTHTATRDCNDPVITLSPQTPYVCCKASFTNAGFSIGISPAQPSEMPLK